MNYTLTKTKKGAKYHYEVKDETGQVIASRTSPRTYVAALINTSGGAYCWFGRLDLIGKGDSKRYMSWYPDVTAIVKLENA